MSAEEAQTQHIAVLQTGGLGDLVLTSELVSGIKKAQPGSHVTLICKAAVAGVAELYPIPADDVVAMEFNPYKWDAPSPELLSALRPVTDQLSGCRAKVLIDATFQPSWFGWVAAAAMQPQRACCCTAIDEPEFLVSSVIEKLRLSRARLEKLTLPAETRELERYRLLMNCLGLKPQDVFPWTLPAKIAQQTGRVLEELGLRRGEYLACFPGGSVGAEAKRWPIEKFRQVLMHVQRRWTIPILLIGEKNEREALGQLASSLIPEGCNVQIIAGGRNDIPVVAALLSTARAYLGNDTGPLHIASAYGVPGVGIYGGGHWPAYAPWGQGSVGLLHPLPCFGCDWDCLFGHGICVEAIKSDSVERALDAALAEPGGEPNVQILHTLGEEAEQIIERANLRYRTAQQDRTSRWICIMQQNRALESLSQQIQPLKGQLEEVECERSRLKAFVLALERERLLHFLLRRLRRQPVSTLAAE